MAPVEEALVATLFDQSGEVADQILHHNVLTKVLDEKGNVRRFSGGYEIRKPVLYNDTAVGGFYAGMTAFNLDAVDDMTAFRFPIRQCYEPMVISGRDKRANKSEEQLLDHVENKMKATLSRLKNTVSTSLRGDGTGDGGIGFDGVMKAVSSSPSTGTYGQISRVDYSYARNLKVTATLTAANIQSNLTDAIMQITRGDEGPDLGLCDRTSWKYLHDSMTAIQRITKSDNKAIAGFKALNYDGVDFVFDGGYGSSVLTSNTVRLLNTNYITFDIEREADFKPLTPKMDRPIDQDGFFTVIIVEGNLCFSAPALQALVAA